MFLESYPAGLEAAGASGELIVDWLRAHHFAVMAIDEKARRLVPRHVGEGVESGLHDFVDVERPADGLRDGMENPKMRVQGRTSARQAPHFLVTVL